MRRWRERYVEEGYNGLRHKLLLWQRGGYTPTVQRQETANYAVLSDVER
jgi:hypothetical protein